MQKQIFVTILFTVFIALLGVGIIIPVMPLFATDLGATGFSLGIIIASFSVTRGIMQPFIGSWSDKWGRKRFLTAGLVVFTIVGLLIPTAKDVLHLVFIRSFQGIGSAMIVPVGMAYMSQLAPEGQEGRYMSYLNIAIFCGIGCGPIIGGLVSDIYGMPAVFYVMAVLSFCALLLVVINMPIVAPQKKEREQGLRSNFLKMLRRKRTRGMLIARFSTMIMMVPTMAFLPLLMTGFKNGTGVHIGIVIAGRTLVNAVLQIPFGKLADKYNKTYLLFAGVTCMGGIIFIIPHGTSFPMMLGLYMLLGLGEAIIWPTLGAYATEEGRVHFGHGTMMGVFNLAMSAGVFFGAILGGFTMDYLSIQWAFYVSGAAVLFFTYIGVWLIRSENDTALI